MSISYDASLVCGFRFEVESVSESQTKYDENTGKPYSVDVPSHDIGKVEGVVVGSTKDNADAFCQGETIDGLEIGESGYERGQKWIGVKVARVGEYSKDGDFVELALDVPPEVTAFADKHGLKPKWLLSMSCG